jgi:hypothetical protein
VFSVLFLAVFIFACIKPMDLCPTQNGMEHDYRNQYEMLTESIMNGHFYLDAKVDSKLLKLENPYDPESRVQAKAQYIWDCAYYKGHYYVYFGVVPVFLVFIPYLLITGEMLITYQATQIFVALFICGVFALFYMLARRFFPKLPYSIYLTLSAAVSLISIWYSIGFPALYCTAITAGLCLEIWSLFCYVKAVWGEQSEKKTIIYAFVGGVLGALVFGCRPPIAMASLLLLPMLVVYIKRRKWSAKLAAQLLFFTVPYIIVAILLMLYNYARFQNPFEFGAIYQLTVADIGDTSSQIWTDTLKVILEHFFAVPSEITDFPYVSYCGIFINFPILLLIIYFMCRKNIWARMKKDRTLSVSLVSILSVMIIIVIDSRLGLYASERYHMDVYWLMGILLFLLVGYYYECISDKHRKYYCCAVTLFALFTCIQCFLLFCVPNSLNLTDYNSEWLVRIRQTIFFWEML